MDLKRGIDLAVTKVIEELKKMSKPIKTSEEISQVGTISGNNDLDIGKKLAEAMSTVGNNGVITIEESKTAETELHVVKGMQFDRGYLSPYFVNNPEKLANYVYAKTDGNSEEGDGWKYRGRGFLQHTGKNQYKAIAKYTGVDVVSNPDLLNDPEIAANIPFDSTISVSVISTVSVSKISSGSRSGSNAQISSNLSSA